MKLYEMERRAAMLNRLISAAYDREQIATARSLETAAATLESAYRAALHADNVTHPVFTAAARNIRAARPIAEHRAAAVGPIDFSAAEYKLAIAAFSVKRRAAERRGNVGEKNVYAAHRADMIQTAAAQIVEERRAFMEDWTYYEGPEFAWAYDDMPTDREMLSAAVKACGRLEHDISKRNVPEGTPLEHVAETLKTSAMERRLADMESVKSVRAALDNLVSSLDLPPKRRRAIYDHIANGTLTDIQKRTLKDAAIACGLLKVDVTGRAYIAD